MSWTAVVPLKGAVDRKSRLAPSLDARQRADLSVAMTAHVLGRLTTCPRLAQVWLLSPEQPAWSGVRWFPDMGGGLNVELTRLRGAMAADLLVLHADLPLLAAEDVEAMLATDAKTALAPDRHGGGTNALALRWGGDFTFAFGEGSFVKHLRHAPDAAVVLRPGLQLDVDTPEDLHAARRAGFEFPSNRL